jgi:vacuolar protein sorting-associated protein VTA1
MSTQPSEPPEELKCIRPFLRRGYQMEKLDPVITYYCMLYSVQLALDKKLHVASPECTAFVTNLMETLELVLQHLLLGALGRSLTLVCSVNNN